MKTKTIFEKTVRFIKLIYLKFVRINDSPHKIALGFGLGAFLGILPGTGPIASLFFAVLFRVNRASALIGCLMTNTWISIIAFLFSIKVGSALLGLDWHNVYWAYQQLLKDFHFNTLFHQSSRAVLLPVVLGYLATSLLFAALCYCVAFTIVIIMRCSKRKTSQKNVARS